MLPHFVERGQVLAALYGPLRTVQYLRRRELRQRFEPKLFRLPKLLGITKGRVVLVVIVQPEEGEDLVDGLDQRAIGLGTGFSLPRKCR